MPEAPLTTTPREGLFALGPAMATALRRGARAWTIAVIAVLGVLFLTVGLPHSPDGDGMLASIEQPVQLALLAVGFVGWLVAWRREGVAAVVLVLVGAGLGGLSSAAHQPIFGLVVGGAFAVPAVAFWALWQRARSLHAVVVLAGATAVLLTAGWAGGAATYGYLFGPAHPESPAAALPADRVSWVWSGGVTETSFRATARVDDETAEQAWLVVDDDESASAHRVGPVPVPESRIVTWTVTDLEPDTRYDYTVLVDGQPDGSRGRGSVRTFPDGPASFTVAVGACARTGSNGAVFDAIRDLAPLLYVATGDLHYGNIGVDDIDTFRARYDDVLTAPAQSALYRSTPVAYVWDDHDYGTNDTAADSPSRAAARFSYREGVPHYPLPAGDIDGAIYQAFTVGRVRLVLTDTRSERTDTSMLGAEQLRWFERELITASRDHALVVWVNPDPWIATESSGGDNWGSYQDERRHIAEVIEQAAVDNLIMLSGDAHMLAIDDGSNSGYGPSGRGFPVLHAAALDRPGSAKGGPYSHGALPGAGQFGTVTVTDDGTGPVTVELAGRDWKGQVQISYTFTVP